jgi:O-antigen ligase
MKDLRFGLISKPFLSLSLFNAYKRIEGWEFFLFGLTLPLSININHVCFFIILTKFLAVKKKNKMYVWLKDFVVLLPLYFLITCLSLIYSENLTSGLKGIEKIIYLCLLPLSLSVFLAKDFERTARKIGLGFVGGNLLIGGLFFYDYLKNAANLENLNDDAIQSMTPIHSTYLSLFFACSIILLEKSIGFNSKKGFTAILLTVFFSSAIILSASKLGVVFLIITLGYVTIKIIQKSSKFVGIVFAISIVSILAIIAFKSNLIVDRFQSIMTFNFSRDPVNGYNTFSGRLFFWDCSVENIKKNWIQGVGIGDVQNELDKCYSQKEPLTITPDFLGSYNSHNQFLQTFLGIGIFGLVVLFGLFFYAGRSAIIKAGTNFFLILLLFLIFFIFESVLERDKGVISFCLIICLCYYLPQIDQPVKKI